MPILPSRIPNKLKPRVDFDPELFRKHLITKGLRLRWEMAAECPCRRAGANDLVANTSPLVDILVDAGRRGTTQEARQECPKCKGRGYYHHSAQEIVAILTRSTEKPEPFAPYGEYAKGMVAITSLPEHVPSYQDRFTVLDSVLIYRETLKRTADPLDELRFPAVERLLDLSTGMQPVSVLNCVKADSDGLVDLATSEMQIGTDFVVNGGKIDWSLGDALGTAPSVGEAYSIAYYANPQYVVVDIPHAFRDTWVGTKVETPYFAPLPVQSMCQLEFLTGGRDAD